MSKPPSATMDLAQLEALQRGAVAYARAAGIVQPSMIDYEGYDDPARLMQSQIDYRAEVMRRDPAIRTFVVTDNFSTADRERMARSQIDLIKKWGQP